MITYGIYGYEITKIAELEGFKLIPRSQNDNEIRQLASDQNYYHLTGFLEIDENQIPIPNQRGLIFDLQGILSFIEQKNVIITHPLRPHETYQKLNQDYPLKITFLRRLNGGGSFILSDTYSTESRKICIEKALHKLKESDQNQGVFRSAFFKSIEPFKGSESFRDVNYYLLFSALESLSRYHLNHYSRGAVKPIAKFLQLYEFDIKDGNNLDQYQISDFIKAVATYTNLRNALFHNGQLEWTNKEKTITLKLADYYPNFRLLIPLVMLKYIGFDDGHINWNSWLDLTPFK
ncbi:hypothetical protein LVY74_06885 [Acinetobacter sp. ME22]|uniref:hypothetical protein n=1 Tax=Acinetobacter sp. ME22 TaxID=2904802 RepID=UPI001EDA6800|nr:hypothetical protein [Acinetobacter sp. ME22]MCG2573284.1 hypothetical protein [Acinetobacter sp. ME22]